MTGRSHRLVDRPLGAQRLRAFVAVASVLLLVAGGLVLTAGNRATTPAAAPGSQAPAGAMVAPTLDAAPRSPENDRTVVVGQARRFLAGYLPYLYGQGPARAVRGTTVGLRRRLEAMRLRVPPAAQKRRPRVVRMTAEPLDHGRWHVVATVADGGVSRYPIELLTTSGAGGVRVAEVSSE
jgi:hypothetical protein